MSVSFFSEVAFKEFQEEFKVPYADHFGSFSGRKVEFVKCDGVDFGIFQKEAPLPWRDTARKVGLFILECITIIPALVFLFQKIRFRLQIASMLNETKDSWAERKDAYYRLTTKTDILSNDKSNDWYLQDHKKIKDDLFVKLIKEEVRLGENKDVVLEYFRAFEDESDFIILSNGKRKWKINRNLACINSKYFEAIHEFNENKVNQKNTPKGSVAEDLSEEVNKAEKSSIEIKNSDGEFYSNEAVSILVAYTENGDFSLLSGSNAQEVFMMAKMYQMDQLKAAARKEMLKNLSITKDNLIDVLRWAQLYDDKELILRCASFIYNQREIDSDFDKNFKGFQEDLDRIDPIVSLLEKNKAKFNDGKLIVSHFDQDALKELQYYLKGEKGITALDVRVKLGDNDEAFSGFLEILNEEDSSIREITLDFERNNKEVFKIHYPYNKELFKIYNSFSSTEKYLNKIKELMKVINEHNLIKMLSIGFCSQFMYLTSCKLNEMLNSFILENKSIIELRVKNIELNGNIIDSAHNKNNVINRLIFEKYGTIDSVPNPLNLKNDKEINFVEKCILHKKPIVINNIAKNKKFL